MPAGVRYLRIEGAFYAGIGCLFLLYGYFRAIQQPGMSVVLTVISLGTRVALAYAALSRLGRGRHLGRHPHRLDPGRRRWAAADAAEKLRGDGTFLEP